MTRPNRQIMRASWAMARGGARRFGGRAAQYMREALRLVWSERLEASVAVPIASDRPLGVTPTLKPEESVMNMRTIQRLALGFMIPLIPFTAFAGVTGELTLIVPALAAGLAAFAAIAHAECAVLRDAAYRRRVRSRR